MKNIDLKNIFRRKNKKIDQGHSLAWPIYYIRDWKIMVLCFAVGLVLLSLFAWKIYLSNQIAGGYLAPVIESSSAKTRTVDIKKLEASLLILEDQQAEYLKFKSNRNKLIDPGL
jgi:hypothetical protein